MVYLTLFKDVEAIGYNSIIKHIKLSYSLGASSVNHNITLVRECLKSWAKKYIILGNATDWKYAVRNCDLKGEVSDANLWIDSIDFPIIGGKERKPSSQHWSGKLKHAARRFMVLRDGKGRIRHLWGGYSPKVYDGHFIEVNQEFFQEEIQGGKILADNHFSISKKLFKDPKFYTNYPEPANSRKRKAADMEDLVLETKKRKKYNADQHYSRARIEQPFATIKSWFRSLVLPWEEDLH